MRVQWGLLDVSNLKDLPFIEFPKIPRLRRGCVITEKIDGTNAQVHINDDATDLIAGSRNKWITPEADNYGFARWVAEHKAELLQLGPGSHFGEWWGAGIQRRYGLQEKWFSLFNVGRWKDAVLPECVGLVPTLYEGDFTDDAIARALEKLRAGGSVAAPGFMQPEGIVVFHVASRHLYKVLLENDGQAKGQSA